MAPVRTRTSTSGESATRKAVRAMRDHMTVREMAAALGISTNAVRKHLKALQERER